MAQKIVKRWADYCRLGDLSTHDCAGGRHRTGSMGAVYRMERYGWGYEQVYAEMKQFDFYTSWGHGDFKTFVQDYANKMQARRARRASGQGRRGARRLGRGHLLRQTLTELRS